MKVLAATLLVSSLLAAPALGAKGKGVTMDMRHVSGYASCGGCASERVKEAVRAYVARYAANPTRAACIIGRESGWNPSAISPTGDHGLFQFNYAAHHGWIDFARVTHDVVYAVELYNRLSRWGTNFSPWGGGAYAC